MEFTFTDEQMLVSETVRNLLTDRCTPADVRRAWDDEAPSFDRSLWATLTRLGMLGLLGPEAAGGSGLSFVDLVPVLEESGRVAFPGPIVEHAAVAVPALAQAGEPAGEWLTAALAGELVVTAGLEDSPVEWAHEADLLLLARDGEVRAVYPDAVTVTRRPSVDASRRSYGVQVDGGDLLDGVDAGAMFDRGALGAAVQLVGLAERMLDMTVEYAKQRKQFGVPVGSFQAVKHHLANALIAISYARPVVYRAAVAVAVAEDEPDREREVSFAKVYASRAARTTGSVALQCHGAIGYTFEHDLRPWIKRTWALETAWGSPAFHRRRVADALLKDRRLVEA